MLGRLMIGYSDNIAKPIDHSDKDMAVSSVLEE